MADLSNLISKGASLLKGAVEAVKDSQTLSDAVKAAAPLAEVIKGAAVQIDSTIPTTDAKELPAAWKRDQDVKLADPAPWNLTELKQVVDVRDPRSVAAYWVWAVNRLVDDYDDGMGMMKFLFADLEPYGRGFVEGGGAGRAGWDTYFNERLRDDNYRWLPRAYFNGASAANAGM